MIPDGVIFRILSLRKSATNKFPEASNAISVGRLRSAGAPVEGSRPLVPLPANVDIV